jgi:hypothetical protein
VGQELGGLDPSDRVVYQLTELLALMVGDRSSQVLNLCEALANENNLRNFRNTCDPRVADQLWVKSQ